VVVGMEGEEEEEEEGSDNNNDEEAGQLSQRSQSRRRKGNNNINKNKNGVARPVVLVDGFQRAFPFDEWQIIHTIDEFTVGETIHVCDKTPNNWQQGVVSGFAEGGLPLVILDGWDESFPFDMYRKCVANDALDLKVHPSKQQQHQQHHHHHHHHHNDVGSKSSAVKAQGSNATSESNKNKNKDKAKSKDKKSADKKEDKSKDGKEKEGVGASSSTDKSQGDEGEEELSLLAANYAVVGCLWGFSFVLGPLTGGLLITVGGNVSFACMVVGCSEAISFFVAQVSFYFYYVFDTFVYLPYIGSLFVCSLCLHTYSDMCSWSDYYYYLLMGKKKCSTYLFYSN
jgi:hypothetical protein